MKDLQQEVNDVAGYAVLSFGNAVHDVEAAREDYEFYKETGWSNRSSSMARLIKKRLFEAACSPSAYIREWAKLIREEETS